ncbi:hypothetical protein TrRE_jg1934, partial [Triparma retinervis]
LNKGKRATGQLWTNYHLVRSIRSRYNSSPTSITYSEYSLMNRGVEDRWKILNIVMLMSFAKDVAPYMLMYNPGMLPSTFSARWYDDGRGGEGKGDGDGGVTQGYVEDLIKTDRKLQSFSLVPKPLTLTKHLTTMMKTDEFVITKCAHMGDAKFFDTLKVGELLELASDRLILSPKCGRGEIKEGVRKWYGDVRRQDGIEVEEEGKGFVKVYGRGMLLGANAVKTVRDGRCEARLVGSLYGWR